MSKITNRANFPFCQKWQIGLIYRGISPSIFTSTYFSLGNGPHRVWAISNKRYLDVDWGAFGNFKSEVTSV